MNFAAFKMRSFVLAASDSSAGRRCGDGCNAAQRVNGVNYLLPVDADIKSELDVKLGAAINVDLTLDQTMADAKVKLVFLDPAHRH
jgi:uncharacterized caspase-like protein